MFVVNNRGHAVDLSDKERNDIVGNFFSCEFLQLASFSKVGFPCNRRSRINIWRICWSSIHCKRLFARINEPSAIKRDKCCRLRICKKIEIDRLRKCASRLLDYSRHQVSINVWYAQHQLGSSTNCHYKSKFVNIHTEALEIKWLKRKSLTKKQKNQSNTIVLILVLL